MVTRFHTWSKTNSGCIFLAFVDWGQGNIEGGRSRAGRTQGFWGGRSSSQEMQWRTSLGVQWLRVHAPKQGVCVRSPVRELRSHMPCGTPPPKKYKKRKCNGFHRERALELEATEQRVSTITQNFLGLQNETHGKLFHFLPGSICVENVLSPTVRKQWKRSVFY